MATLCSYSLLHPSSIKLDTMHSGHLDVDHIATLVAHSR
jgi:hypothetical protein